jgi:hypothetical protein
MCVCEGSFDLVEPVCCGGDVFATDYEAEAVVGQTFGAAVFAGLG